MIRIGAIGCGPFMAAQHLQTIRRADDLTLVHLADIDEAALKAAAGRFGPERASTRWQDVIEDPAVDVVVVGVVPKAHPIIARAAIEAGKSLYVEKPLAETTAEALAVHRLARQRRVSVAVGFNRRFAPATAAVARAFAGAGRPVSVSYRLSDDDRVRPPSQQWKKADRLVVEAVHIFDLLAWLIASEPVRIFARQARFNDDLVTIEFADGSVASIHSSSYGTLAQPKEHLTAILDRTAVEMIDFVEVRTYGAAGSYQRACFAGRAFDGYDNAHVAAFAAEGLTAYQALRTRYHQALIDSGVLDDSGDQAAWARFAELLGSPPPPQINYCPDKGWGASLETFCRAVAHGVPAPNAAPADAVRANACAAAARKSIDSGLPVALSAADWDSPEVSP
jgi:predicted dehydrogenase